MCHCSHWASSSKTRDEFDNKMSKTQTSFGLVAMAQRSSFFKSPMHQTFLIHSQIHSCLWFGKCLCAISAIRLQTAENRENRENGENVF